MKHLKTFEQHSEQINEGILDSKAYNGASEFVETPQELFNLSNVIAKEKANGTISEEDYNLFNKSVSQVKSAAGLPDKVEKSNINAVKSAQIDINKIYKKGTDIKNLTYELLDDYIGNRNGQIGTPSGSSSAGVASNDFEKIFKKYQSLLEK